MKMNKKGFTLIELLIVVAIIAILAAIAIPQFAQYRIRGFNAACLTDTRNTRTSQETLFSDWRVYGASENALETAVVGGVGAGAIAVGPTTLPANPTSLGTIEAATGVARGLPFAVGAGNELRAGDSATRGSYVIQCKSTQGDTSYVADSDSVTVYRGQSSVWVGLSMTAPGAMPLIATQTDGAIEPALLAAPWGSM